MTIVAIPTAERKETAPDVRVSAGLGRALYDANAMLVTFFPQATHPGSQFDLTRTAALTVIGKAVEMDSRMSVRELFNLLSTGRR